MRFFFTAQTSGMSSRTSAMIAGWDARYPSRKRHPIPVWDDLVEARIGFMHLLKYVLKP